ncbi:unnamed protein product, partial [Closterium sp. Naga37s-1]
SLDTPWTTIRTTALADAKTVVVGWRYSRWNTRVRTWPAPRVFSGDVLVFKWNDWVRRHNLVAVDANRYNLCHFGASGDPFTVLHGPSNRATVKVTVGDSTLTGYYTSSSGNDCLTGMKVVIIAEDAA